MRESFGGAFMIKLILCLIVIYVTLMSIGIIYARAFRVKNQVINIIEQYQYAGEANSKAETEMEKYLRKANYSFDDEQLVKINNDCTNRSGNAMNGICVIANNHDGSNSRYYKIIAYVYLDFPLFDLNLLMPISGETKTMRY